MCGPRARTNFHSNSNDKILSATLTAKLQRCQMTSLQMDKKTATKAPHEAQSPHGAKEEGEMGAGLTTVSWPGCVGKECQVESDQQQIFKPLEDDHIEQMIEELLDCGSMELCSVVPS